MSASRMRGQPAIALVVVLAGWVLARASMLGLLAPAELPAELPADLPDIARPAPTDVRASGNLPLPSANGSDAAKTYFPGSPTLPSVRSPRPAATSAMASSTLSVGPHPPERAYRPVAAAVVTLPALPARSAPRDFAAEPGHSMELAAGSAGNLRDHRRAGSRWSGDSWMVLRQNGRAPALGSFAGPSYGASQVGAVLRYRLGSASTAGLQGYIRGSSALSAPSDRELALGLAVRPLRRVPAILMGEGRMTWSGRAIRVRPAIALVSAVPPVQLPLSLRGEVYAQAGYVGGTGATVFIDGQVRVDRALPVLGLARLRLGGGVWGGAQRGAARLDVGPGLTLTMPLGPANVRVAADWRFRVAGRAEPASGPALTLSAGF
jgi:hypothetical protein